MSRMRVDYLGLNQIYSFIVIVSPTNKYRKHKSGMLIWVIPIGIDYFHLCPSQILYASGPSCARHKLFMRQDHLMSVTNCLCTVTILCSPQTVHHYHLMSATNCLCTSTILCPSQTVYHKLFMHQYRLMFAINCLCTVIILCLTQTVYAPLPSYVRHKLFMHQCRLMSATNCLCSW